MKSMMNFMKTMLIMPIHWQVWLGALVAANIIMPLFFIDTMEAQIVLATALGGLAIMAVIFSDQGFVRLMGIGHTGWIPLVLLLWWSLDFAPAHSAFAYWLMAVIALDSLSVMIDTVDVLRYVKGERQPFLALPAEC